MRELEPLPDSAPALQRLPKRVLITFWSCYYSIPGIIVAQTTVGNGQAIFEVVDSRYEHLNSARDRFAPKVCPWYENATPDDPVKYAFALLRCFNGSRFWAEAQELRDDEIEQA